ncbi:hypothetical protein CC80DRAFT_526903 [Byssothecium circinans]|uniref:Uncharacterized protein n=1 Tax=Byssothecium circinans TaxID=147558 RepID=A0A6A5TR82_9PLEO|nr:hypothetical protein CC80DRAFT_526903 [Byssothecium circinans]
MLANFITLLPFLSLAIAAPAAADAIKETKIARYDDLPFTEGSFNPIPPHYYGLSYFTFQVDQYDGFIPPTSGNQTAMAFGGSGNISIPDQPPNQTFELDSFSFACVSGVPQPECAISVWGWKADDSLIKRVIKFPKLDPAPIEAYVMNRTRFSGQWKGLKSLGFSIARADNGGDMFGGLALDDVKYTITTPR